MHNTGFIVVMGKLVLHSKRLGTIGVVKMGDSLGEEALLEARACNRKESAYAESETYVFEVSRERWKELKQVLIHLGQRKDFILVENLLRKNFTQKKSWRQYKSKMNAI